MDAVDTTTPEPRTLGQDLAAERERHGLSRAEVAQRLHMSAWQVEALEAGDYARLPQGTFLRGFVRNYAKVLGLDPNVALQRLEAPRGPAPGIVVPSQNIRFDPLGERLANPYVKAGGLAVAFIALGFAVMYWWLFIRPSPPAQASQSQSIPAAPTPQNIAAAPMSAPEPVVPRSAPTEPTPVTPSPALPQGSTKPATPAPALPPGKGSAASKAEAPKVEAPKVEAPKVEPPKPEPTKAETRAEAKAAAKAAADRTLKLRFRGESWVEVKDRNGKVLISRLNTPGSEAEVTGRPPFAVIIGNAPDVQMLYNDREFPLEPHTRVAVARFTLE
jgi:cytoskeleton protein RodZ